MVSEVDPLIESIYRWSDVSGVLLMGIIGGTIARQRGYDIIGFFFIAMFSALGGGMIRDVLINRGTVAAMSQPEYLYLAFAGALIARFVYFKGKTWEHLQAHGDALVSALWAGTGTVKALTYGLPVVPCIMMGVFTAIGGSMIRDVCMGREPAVFGDNQPIVIPAAVCSVIVLAGNGLGFLAWGMILGPVASFALALLGYWTGWRVSTDQEWAPVNETAAQVAVLARKAEDKSRAVGRRLEPRRLRSWRHKQMENALERRIAREIREGKRPAEAQAAANEFLEEFNSEVAQLSEASQVAADAGEKMASESAAETGSTVLSTFANDIGMDLAGDSYQDKPDHQRMLDAILADDKLTDELIDKLAEKYDKRQRGADA